MSIESILLITICFVILIRVSVFILIWNMSRSRFNRCWFIRKLKKEVGEVKSKPP